MQVAVHVISEDNAFSSNELSECIPPFYTCLSAWRQVCPGICVEGVCRNPDCVAFGRRVLYNHGFRSMTCDTPTLCPCCKTPFQPSQLYTSSSDDFEVHANTGLCFISPKVNFKVLVQFPWRSSIRFRIVTAKRCMVCQQSLSNGQRFHIPCAKSHLQRIEIISQHVVGFFSWNELAVFVRLTRAANTEVLWKTKLDH